MATTTSEPTFEARTRVVIEPETGERTGRDILARPRSSSRPVPLSCAGSAAPSLHGARLTRRGRIVVALVWLVLTAAGVLAFARPSAESDPADPPITVEVQAGDTLWVLAAEVAPDADPREIVAAIVELNDLRSAADIRPGDALLVPASG